MEDPATSAAQREQGALLRGARPRARRRERLIEKRLLEDIKVIQAGRTLSAAYCGRLRRDLGADVIKVEPEGGDPLRDESPAFASFLYGGHRSVSAVTTAAGLARVRDLAATADVIVCDGDDWSMLVEAGRLREQNPALVAVAVSGYGLDGPDAGRSWTELTLQAEAGIIALHGTPGRPPVTAGVRLAE